MKTRHVYVTLSLRHSGGTNQLRFLRTSLLSGSSIKLSLCLLDDKMQDCDDKIDLLKPHIAKEKQEALRSDMMAAEMSIRRQMLGLDHITTR